MNINLTPSAKKRIKEININNPEKIFVFGMKQAGCSGYEYTFNLANNNSELEVITIDGLIIGIEKKVKDFFNESIIDYQTDQLNQRFVINNPNAKSVCGCGISINF